MTKRTSFAHQPAPMIVGVIRERTPNDVKAVIKNGEVRGARGFDLHLDALDQEFWTVDAIKSIVDSTDKPILALNYRKGYYETLTMTEEERTGLLMTAVDAGVSAVDIQGFTFDMEAEKAFVDDAFIPAGFEFLKEKRPREVALKPEIIEKQQKFVAEVHEKGAEVLISMHFGTQLAAEELVKLARFAHDVRGADIVKMVTPCESKEQLSDCISATLTLTKELDFPYSYHANGRAGYRSRIICPMLGSYLMFCNVDYGYSSNFGQLHLESMTEAYRRMGII